MAHDVTTDRGGLTHDLYIWAKPHDLDADLTATLLGDWQAAGGDPAASPFKQSTDLGWFYRELTENVPHLDALTDAVPRVTKTPIWMSGSDEPPARIVAIRLSRPVKRDELEAIFSLATKYDLEVFDANRGTVQRPTEQLAAYASATFWPRGAIRAGVAGLVGAAIAAGAWVIGIPIVSGVAIVVGAFLALMAVSTFAHEILARLRRW